MSVGRTVGWSVTQTFDDSHGASTLPTWLVSPTFILRVSKKIVSQNDNIPLSTDKGKEGQKVLAPPLVLYSLHQRLIFPDSRERFIPWKIIDFSMEFKAFFFDTSPRIVKIDLFLPKLGPSQRSPKMRKNKDLGSFVQLPKSPEWKNCFHPTFKSPPRVWKYSC